VQPNGKLVSPRYFPISYDDGSCTVETDEGILIDDIASYEAAEAIATLCCLNQVVLNKSGELVILTEPLQDYDLASDDAPEEEEEEDVEITEEGLACPAVSEVEPCQDSE
jgi:hypothetical protein